MNYMLNGIPVVVTINSNVYNLTAGTRYYEVRKTYNTWEEAKAKADSESLTWFGGPAAYGFPVRGTCYVSDPSVDYAGYGMVSHVQHSNGIFSLSNGLSVKITSNTTECSNQIGVPYAGTVIDGYFVGSRNQAHTTLQNWECYEYVGSFVLPNEAYKNGRPDPEWFSDPNHIMKATSVSFGYGYASGSNYYYFDAYAQITTAGNVSLSHFYDTFKDLDPVSETDPYSQGGDSESQAPAGSSYFTGIGGNGTYTSPGFSGGVPSLPTLSAVDTGLLRLYCSSSAAGMNGLANYLWSSAFDLDTFKKLFADPMELIFGAAILPCTPTNTASVIIFGNVNTGVSMPQATAQYVSVDCGGLNIPLYYGTFLDYAPHTKISIYLPYIGMRELNATEIVGKTLGVVYHVDVLTGACVAFVTVNGVVMYEYSGSCAVQIPITSNNWASVLQSLATIGGSAIGGFAVGGPVGAVVAGGASAASNAASGGLTPSFARGGSVSGSAGLLADQNPYIVMEIPNMCKASGQNWFEGYPNYTTQKLSMCEGYTKVSQINLEGIGCTATELQEIENLLKGGVLI